MSNIVVRYPVSAPLAEVVSPVSRRGVETGRRARVAARIGGVTPRFLRTGLPRHLDTSPPEEELVELQMVETRMPGVIAGNPEALALLLDLARVLGSTLDGGRLATRAAELLGARLGCDVAALLVPDPQTRLLRVAGSFGSADPETLSAAILNDGDGGMGDVLCGDHPIHVPDVALEPRFAHMREALRAPGAAVLSPIRVGDCPMGVLVLVRSHPAGFSDELRALVAAAVEQLGPALRNARVHQRARALASFDSLTGLTNRHRILQSLDQEWKRHTRLGSPLSVIMVDIDHFKTFNDQCGHLYGDRVLQRVAHTLRDTIRGVDVVGRYGGDEFVVVLPDTTLEQARTVAEKLRRAVEERCGARRRARPGAGSVTITLGIAQATPDMRSVKELLGEADRRLLESKVRGRNRVGVKG